jgi:hypothetical protein
VPLGPQNAIRQPNIPHHLRGQLKAENLRTRASSTGNSVSLGPQGAVPPPKFATHLRGKSNAENQPTGRGLHSRPSNVPSPKARRQPSGAQGEERIRRSITDPDLKPSTGWAAPTGLEKTRQTVHKRVVAKKKAEISRYLGAPDQNTSFPATVSHSDIGEHLLPCNSVLTTSRDSSSGRTKIFIPANFWEAKR